MLVNRGEMRNPPHHGPPEAVGQKPTGPRTEIPESSVKMKAAAGLAPGDREAVTRQEKGNSLIPSNLPPDWQAVIESIFGR